MRLNNSVDGSNSKTVERPLRLHANKFMSLHLNEAAALQVEQPKKLGLPQKTTEQQLFTQQTKNWILCSAKWHSCS